MGFLRNLILILLFSLVVLVLLNKTGHTAANYESETYYRLSHDIDHAEVHEYATGIKKLFNDRQYIGTSIGNSIFIEDNQDNIKYSFLNLSARKNITSRFFYLEGDLRFYNDADPTYNLSVVALNEWKWRVELYTEKSFIDSHAALGGELFFTTYGISADYEIIKDMLYTTGVLFTQSANDGNNRTGQVLQLIYYPEQLSGFYVKVRGKFRQADFNPPEYFTPDDYKRYDLLFGYRKYLDKGNWRISGEIGPSKQYINDVAETGYEYKFNIYGLITQSIRIEATYGSSTDNGEYKYEYSWGELNFRYYW
ncbi:MAG: hypothetical protein KAH32_09050 [Chlamydiia bacterium]|nr:hypothetical protein [Chlamydiia bacterium]